MRSDQEIKELINIYILDALGDNERSEAEEFLTQPEYLKYYKETKFILSETTYSIENYELPEDLKSELLSKIDLSDSQESEESPSTGGFGQISRIPRFSYAIAASIIAVLFIYTFYLNE